MSFRYTSALERAPGDLLGESPETTVLEHAHGPGALAHDRRHLADLETADHAQQDHFGLVSREECTNESNGGRGPGRVESSRRRVIVPGTIYDIGGQCDTASPRFIPAPVDETIPRDGEHPGAELHLVPIEVREISSGHVPGFGFDVVRGDRVEPAQEAEQAWVQLAPQDGDRLVRALPSGLENLDELRRRHVSR